jgi:hypothetical protein
MKYCKKCALRVNTCQPLCPLCASDLSDLDGAACPSKDDPAGRGGAARQDDGLYPADHDGIKYDLTIRIFLFLSVLAVGCCVLINILAYRGILWSLIVAGGVGFAWAAVGYPIAARKNIGHHIAVDAVCLCLFFVMAQFVTKTTGWSLDYVIPFLFIAATTVITFVILIRRMKWREYALYQFVTIILGLLPVISVVAGLVESVWPSIASAFYSFITLLGMFIFADKKYKNELIKRFHF